MSLRRESLEYRDGEAELQTAAATPGVAYEPAADRRSFAAIRLLILELFGQDQSAAYRGAVPEQTPAFRLGA